ncbi:MAG: helix-turn-helix transcriptional regulator [Burkholderiaceae bacterium]|nr:helix-turn-helix transcriptional regulator [Burkholderiaceae bacterium]
MNVPATFGKTVSNARKAREINQKQLAERIKREDGEPISPQYLNDIEHDRRSPSSEVILQIAELLDLDADYLHFLAKKWPEDLSSSDAKPEDVRKLMVAFRKSVAK